MNKVDMQAMKRIARNSSLDEFKKKSEMSGWI